MPSPVSAKALTGGTTKNNYFVGETTKADLFNIPDIVVNKDRSRMIKSKRLPGCG